MSDPVLTVAGLGKVFRRYRREIDRVLGWFSIKVAPADERWVLRDITFDVQPGQALGIVGRNGTVNRRAALFLGLRIVHGFSASYLFDGFFDGRLGCAGILE